MRRSPFACAVVSALMVFARGGALEAQSSPDASAPGTPDSAYVALRVMGKALGRDSLDRVVEVTGRDGVPQPSLWKIVIQDGAGGTREVEVAGGKITAQRPSPKPPVSREVIHLQDLNLDSSGAFDATDAQARKVHLRFDSVNYVLRAGETTGKPVWTLSLFNQEGVDVGAMHLGANDGSIGAIDGRLATGPAAPTATPARTPAVVSSSRSSDSVTTVSRPRDSVPASTRSTELRTTTTTTTVVGNPPPPPPPPLPPAPPTTPTETVVVENAPADRGDGGLFTRTGRTLDKTSHNVEDTLRRTGSRVQRFFTGGHSDNSEPQPAPTHGPDYRGD